MGELDPQTTDVDGEEELDSLEDPRPSRGETLNQRRPLRVPSRSGHWVPAAGRTPARTGLSVLPRKEGMDRRGSSLVPHPHPRVESSVTASSTYTQLSSTDNDSTNQNEDDQEVSPDPKAASSQTPKNPVGSTPTATPRHHVASNMLRDKSRLLPGAKAESSASRHSHSSTSEEDSSVAAQPLGHGSLHRGSSRPHSRAQLSRGWKDGQDAPVSGSHMPSRTAVSPSGSSLPLSLTEGSEEEDTNDGGGVVDRDAGDTRQQAEVTAQTQQTRPALGHFSLTRNKPFSAHSRNPNRFPRFRGLRLQPSGSPQSTSASKVLSRSPSQSATHTRSNVFGDGEDEEPLPATVVNDRTPSSSRHPASGGWDTLRRGPQRGPSLYRKDPIPENPKAAGADVHPGGKSPLSSKSQDFEQRTNEDAHQTSPGSTSRQLSPARLPAPRSQPFPGSTVPRRMTPGRSSEVSSSQSKSDDRSHTMNSRGALPSASQSQDEDSQSSYEENSTEIEILDSRTPTHSARAKDATPSTFRHRQVGSQIGNSDSSPQPSHTGASVRPSRPGSSHPRAQVPGRAGFQATPVRKISPSKGPLPPESLQSVFTEEEEEEEEEKEGLLKGKEDSLSTLKWPSSSSHRGNKYADRNFDKDRAAIGLVPQGGSLVQEENVIPGRRPPGSPSIASHPPPRYQPRNPGTASPTASTHSWPRYTTRAPPSYSSTTPMLSLRQRMQRRFRTPVSRQPPRPVLAQGNWFSLLANQPFLYFFLKSAKWLF